MRMITLVAVMLLPAVAIAYHYGPGQALMALDDASVQLQQAEKFAKQERFSQAIKSYDAALAKIPSDRVDLSRRVRLERAKARLNNQGLAEAYDDLMELKDEIEAKNSTAPADFDADLRKTIANAQYYMTWLLRLEGEAREKWEPDIEASRQNFKLLADAARNSGQESVAMQHESDLESAIRLARMDLSDLQALPLPKQCQGCCSGNCKGKCKGKGKSPKQGEQKPEDARGAGSGPPPDEKGS